MSNQTQLHSHQHRFQLDSSYNEYCVPRRVLWGDTTTDQTTTDQERTESPADDAPKVEQADYILSQIKEPGVGGEVCELQEITRAVVSGRMAKQQQTLLSNSIILI